MLAFNAFAPHTGAWIETISEAGVISVTFSHPTRVRGLKLNYRAIMLLNQVSHPTRVRGLKLFMALVIPLLQVFAPHTGAWIETTHTLKLARVNIRTPHGCVD